MSNPPPPRPWMRLASIARPALPTAPAPAPPPPPASVSAPVLPQESSPAPPRSPLARPTFRTSAPPSPAMSPVFSPPPPVAPPAVVASAAPAPSPPSFISPTRNVEAPTMEALPAISTFSVPPSPNTRGSVPSSPIIKAPKPTAVEIANPSPKLIRTSAQSPPQPSPYRPQPPAPPPSPLTLPPSQLKYEAETELKIPPEVQQKTVLTQNGKGESRSAIPVTPPKPNVESKEKNEALIKKLLDSNEMGARVVTIAGENRGSFMEIIQNPGNADSYFQRNGRRVGKKNEDSGKEISDTDQNDDRNLNSRNKDQKTKGTTHSLPAKAFMNSNVQGVNNSILFNSSCSHHDPGVHLSLTRKPSGNGFQSKHQSGNRHT